MEENAKVTARRGETSLRLSELANEALSKLTREWKAASKKEALEAMIRYFRKLGISPLEEVPDTVGKRLEKRVDQIISFIRQNEKIHREEIEKVVLHLRQQLGSTVSGSNASKAPVDQELSAIQQQLEDIRQGMLTLSQNEQKLAGSQEQISDNLVKQNEMITRRLVLMKDAAAVAVLIKTNLKNYTDSVLANPQQRANYEQKMNDFFEIRLGLKWS